MAEEDMEEFKELMQQVRSEIDAIEGQWGSEDGWGKKVRERIAAAQSTLAGLEDLVLEIEEEEEVSP
jgi:hypothetical protein